MSDNNNDDAADWPVIRTDSRAEALADGTLIDVSATAKDVGIKLPTAVTAAVWAEFVRVPKASEWQYEGARLWYLLWILRLTIKCHDKDISELQFTPFDTNAESRTMLGTLKAVYAPDDDLEPVITIMLPDEVVTNNVFAIWEKNRCIEEPLNAAAKREATNGGIDDVTDFPVIHTYSRAEALTDGVLIDVSEEAKEAGIKCPTAVTSAVWEAYVRTPEGVVCLNLESQLWVIRSLLNDASRRLKIESSPIGIETPVTFQGWGAKLVTLKAVCSPGDDMEPVITIMMPDED